jgi:uncharacterized membrane protein
MLFVLGLILVIITVVVYPRLTKEVNNTSCPNDVKSVADNIKYTKIFFVSGIVLLLIGIVLMIV